MGVWHSTFSSTAVLLHLFFFCNLQSRTLRGKFAHFDLKFKSLVWQNSSRHFDALGFYTSFCLGMPCKHIFPQRHVCWESCDIISCGDPHVVLACVCVLIQTIAGHTWAPDTDQRTTKIREACSYIVNTLALMYSETLDWTQGLIHGNGCNFLLQTLLYTRRDS